MSLRHPQYALSFSKNPHVTQSIFDISFSSSLQENIEYPAFFASVLQERPYLSFGSNYSPLRAGILQDWELVQDLFRKTYSAYEAPFLEKSLEQVEKFLAHPPEGFPSASIEGARSEMAKWKPRLREKIEALLREPSKTLSLEQQAGLMPLLVQHVANGGLDRFSLLKQITLAAPYEKLFELSYYVHEARNEIFLLKEGKEGALHIAINACETLPREKLASPAGIFFAMMAFEFPKSWEFKLENQKLAPLVACLAAHAKEIGVVKIQQDQRPTENIILSDLWSAVEVFFPRKHEK